MKLEKSVPSKMTQRPTFSDFPRDILYSIGKKSPQTARTLGTLSKTIRDRSRDAYLEQICDQDITLGEINEMVVKRPSFGYHIIKDYPVYGYGIGYAFRFGVPKGHPTNFAAAELFVKKGPEPKIEYHNPGNYKRSGVTVHIEKAHPYEDPKDIWSLSQIDLVTAFEIYKTRLDCMTRDPSYARKRVLKTFDIYRNEYENHPSPLNTLLFYAYLALQSFALGLLSSGILFDIEDKSEYKIKTMINELLPRVQEGLEQLE